MQRLTRFLHSSVGRRGAFLAAQGSLFVAYGYALVVTVGPRPPDERKVYTVVEMVAPLHWWAALWIATGLLSLAAAWCRRARFTRALAFSGLMGLATLWATGLGAADLVTGVDDTNSWLAGLLFLALMASIAVVAGWAEPPPPPEMPT